MALAQEDMDTTDRLEREGVMGSISWEHTLGCSGSERMDSCSRTSTVIINDRAIS